MAVLVEAYSVICRLETLNRSYPGGIEAYERSIPNGTYCKDAFLCRVGFSHGSDVHAWLDICENAGLKVSDGSTWIDVAVVVQGGRSDPCPWLAIEVEASGTMWASLANASPQARATPAEWQAGCAVMLDRETVEGKGGADGGADQVTVYIPKPRFANQSDRKPWWKFWS